jgi:hypothetical protein
MQTDLKENWFPAGIFIEPCWYAMDRQPLGMPSYTYIPVLHLLCACPLLNLTSEALQPLLAQTLGLGYKIECRSQGC